MLAVQHGIQISERTFRRIYKDLNLKRKNIEESKVEEIIWAIIQEVYGSGFNKGYRSMWRKLRRKGFHVTQETVRKILKLVDPDGVEARTRCRLSRRRYSVCGPNQLWHLDGLLNN